ncbi:hypothetical protein HK097_000448 [Rhizophlyctis rosea]|uniref:Uncharacterized protein n=1 Tax=Rhizophlyctis rosea TaxID=64517 RepID=A0AAD5S5J1_9FUNG|nr:hypothetical protein HK097_000448 [Rhizophlyctis rosea]
MPPLPHPAKKQPPQTPFTSEYRAAYRDPHPALPKRWRQKLSSPSSTSTKNSQSHHIAKCEIASAALVARKSVPKKGSKKEKDREVKEQADRRAERRLDEALGEGKAREKEKEKRGSGGKERKVKFSEEDQKKVEGSGRVEEGRADVSLPPLPVLTLDFVTLCRSRKQLWIDPCLLPR